MMNMADFFAAAADAPDSVGGGGDLLGHEDVPAGTQLRVKFEYVKGEIKAGKPRLTIKAQVDDPESPFHEGQLWSSVYFSDGSTEGGRSFNKRQFAKLAAAGLGADFFSTNPSIEQIGKAVKSSPGVLLTVGWQKPGDDGRVFDEHTWAPLPSAGGTPDGWSPSV